MLRGFLFGFGLFFGLLVAALFVRIFLVEVPQEVVINPFTAPRNGPAPVQPTLEELQETMKKRDQAQQDSVPRPFLFKGKSR